MGPAQLVGAKLLGAISGAGDAVVMPVGGHNRIAGLGAQPDVSSVAVVRSFNPTFFQCSPIQCSVSTSLKIALMIDHDEGGLAVEAAGGAFGVELSSSSLLAHLVGESGGRQFAPLRLLGLEQGPMRPRGVVRRLASPRKIPSLISPRAMASDSARRKVRRIAGQRQTSSRVLRLG